MFQNRPNSSSADIMPLPGSGDIVLLLPVVSGVIDGKQNTGFIGCRCVAAAGDGQMEASKIKNSFQKHLTIPPCT